MDDPTSGETATAAPVVAGRIAVALMVIAVVVHGLRPIVDLDLWWHMRLGELLLAGDPSVAGDVFSHTQAGTPWPWKDAGTAILFHSLWELGGPAAIIGFKALMFGGLAWLLWRLLRHERRIPASLAMVIAAATLDAVAFRFTERGASVSMVLLVAVLLLIERDRRGARGLWWAIPLTILNANVHRAALLLPVVLGVYAAVCLLARLRGGDRPWRPAAMIAAASGLGCLVTPYGIAIVTTTIALMGQHSPLITEWAPVTPALMWALTPASFATIGMLAIGGVLGQWRVRPWSAWDLALVVLAFGLGLGSMRHLPMLALLGAAPAATGLATLRRAWTGRSQGSITMGAAAVLLASTLARPIAWPGTALAPAHFPERGVAFVQSLPQELAPRGAVFNEFGYGGFLLFHLWPEHRVYIDGRTDLVYPAAHVERYAECLHDPKAFAAEAEARQIEWVFLDNVPFDRARIHFDLDPSWALVHASRRALIYVRSNGPNAALAEAHAYRLLAPHDLPGSLRAAVTRGHGAAALEELRRMVDDDPDNIHALAAMALLAPRSESP